MKPTEKSPLFASENLYRRVAHRLAAQFCRQLPVVIIDRALTEARQVAEQAGWPLLLFPLLAEETIARLVAFAGGPALAHAA